MIKSLTIRNFRSIKDEQVLDLTAAKSKELHEENAVIFEGKKFAVLKSIGIYGANASGKSNILLAFRALEYMITESSDWKLDETIQCYEPFKFDKKTSNAPSMFEVEFIGEDKLLYIYRVEFTVDAILHESLGFYPTTQKANLFSRSVDKEGNLKFTPGARLKGKVKSIPCLKNNLYLSKAANTEGAPEILKDIYRFFKHRVVTISPNNGIEARNLLKNKKQRNAMIALLACADTGITGIQLKEQDINVDSLQLPEELPETFKKHIIENNKYKPVFFHHDNNECELSLEEESRGTRRLFEISPLLLVGLRRGDIIIIDEIDSSLHPHISEILIKLFHDPMINKNGAQLIFTTHDMTLMNAEFMRRDQIVLTEKDDNGATELFSLDGIEGVRKDSPYAKWYMDGRMGAVPRLDISRLKQLLKDEE